MWMTIAIGIEIAEAIAVAIGIALGIKWNFKFSKQKKFNQPQTAASCDLLLLILKIN